MADLFSVGRFGLVWYAVNDRQSALGEKMNAGIALVYLRRKWLVQFSADQRLRMT